jgi:TetR/AcrR family transcriptional regulator, transcriptional repressor of aconitase
MPKVSQSYLDTRRAQILDAAIVCFSREGFHRTTVQEIVKQSRLSPGAIYNYFNSKEEIIEAISTVRHDQERKLILEAKEEATVAGALKRIRNAFFSELKNPKERLRRRVSIQLWAEAQRNPRILKVVRRNVDEPRKLLSGILAEAQQRGEISSKVDAGATASFLIAAFHGIVLQVEWDEHISIEPYLHLLDNFLESISSST